MSIPSISLASSRLVIRLLARRSSWHSSFMSCLTVLGAAGMEWRSVKTLVSAHGERVDGDFDTGQDAFAE